MARPYYRVRVAAGGHDWTVESTDAPAPGPTLPLSFGWAVPDNSLGFPAQPDPATASVAILAPTAADVDGIDIDTPLTVQVWLDPAATLPFAEFHGRVADIEAAPHRTHGTVYKLLCVDYTVDLAPAQVGATAWPAETGEARAARILAEAGVAVPAGLGPVPGGYFAARDAAAASARDQLVETLAHGVVDEGRYLIGAGADLEFRWVERAVSGIDTLDACDLDAVAAWRRTKRTSAAWVTINHPGGPTTYGATTGVPHPPLTSQLTDPADLADYLLDNVAGYQWDAGTLRLHLWAAADKVPVSRWFDHGPVADVHPGIGRAVVVEGLPAPQAPGGQVRYSGMLSAARFTIPPGGRYFVDFRVRADVPNRSFQVVRWQDLDPAMTWDSMPAATTWHDYDPGESAGGSGVLTLRWSDLDPAVTWDTFDPDLTWFDHRTIPHP